MGLKEKQQKVVQEFSQIDSWEERYKKIIALGKQLPSFSDEEKKEDLLIRGCQSQVWLKAQLTERGTIKLSADSDAMIVKGLVYILLQIYSEATPDEILKSTPDFMKELGLEAHLSPSRANGLYAMIKQIMYYATAFKMMQARG